MESIEALRFLYQEGDTTKWIAAIGGLLTVIGGLVTAIVAARKQLATIPIERQEAKNKDREQDADIVVRYQQIAQSMAEDYNKLWLEAESVRKQAQTDITNIRAETETLRAKLDQRDAELREKDDIITARDHVILDMQDWVSRLRYQVQSHGDRPVPFRSSYKDVDTQRWSSVDRGTGPINLSSGDKKKT